MAIIKFSRNGGAKILKNINMLASSKQWTLLWNYIIISYAKIFRQSGGTAKEMETVPS